VTDVAEEVINNAIFDEAVPQIAQQEPTSVKLLRGVRAEEDGVVTWHMDAEVRELTGEDEEALAAIERKEGVLYTEYMNALLSRAVTRVGDLPGSETVLSKLILADREILFLAILRATYGPTRDLHTVCYSCGTPNTVTIDLIDDFPYQSPEFDPREPFDVKGRKQTYRLRLPNADDTVFAQRHGKTDPEVNTAMLSRCVVFDQDAPEDPLDWAKKLNVADRRKLINALLDVKIGPRLEGVDTHCAECGVEMPILLDWVSLLLS